MKRALVQINRLGPCPVFEEIAKSLGFEVIWFTPELDPTIIDPHVVILQCAAQWYDLHTLKYDKLQCPIVASCGDASTITNLDAVFNNLDIITHLHVEGYDYFDKYSEWCVQNNKPKYNKLIFQKLCADCQFPYLHLPKKWDWAFAGQVYPAHEERLSHYRNTIIKDLYARNESCFIAGNGWDAIIPRQCQHVPQDLLNQYYASSHVVVSIDAHNGSGYTSTRTIESMHAGHCTAIYDHAGMASLKNHIIDGVHAFYFKTVDQLLEIIDSVKHNEPLALGMGKAARELVLRMSWTYTGWVRAALTSQA